MSLKSFIITMKGRKFSEELSADCVESCKKFNLEYEIFDAIQQDAVEPTYNKLGLRPFAGLKSSRNTKGIKGCFCSHYLLWKKCMDNNETILVLEHDAVVIRPIPDLLLDLFDDILILDAHSRTAIDYSKKINEDCGLEIDTIKSNNKNTKLFAKHLNNIHIKGAHAYILKPNGAKKLIQFTDQYGVMPADIQINAISVDLKFTKTVFCRVNKKYWIDKSKKSKHSYTRTDI